MRGCVGHTRQGIGTQGRGVDFADRAATFHRRAYRPPGDEESQLVLCHVRQNPRDKYLPSSLVKSRDPRSVLHVTDLAHVYPAYIVSYSWTPPVVASGMLAGRKFGCGAAPQVPPGVVAAHAHTTQPRDCHPG